MIAATARARATLDQFIVRIQAKPDPNHRGFAIKAAFASPDGECEHIWITSPTWDGQQFTGQIDNEPLATKLVKLGDVVHVKPDELTDWMYLDSNQLVGGYTVRLLYPTVRAKKDD
ncbi:MAG TPA: DUF2314 domain-containing protein [Tepidisphaeraceae bacterium]|nr:DUF2314 domain-containing protein [Tepidisphaeraceae bacterium]